LECEKKGVLCASAGIALIRDAKNYSHSENLRSACYGIERYRCIPGIQKAVELGSAGLKLLRHGLLCLPLPLHFLFQLPGEDTLVGDCFNFLSNSVFLKEAIESRATEVALFASFFFLH